MNKSTLIPIKKAVFDPRGLLLRTYYIRPENLTKVIKELKEKAVIYIKDRKIVDKYELVEKTGDISYFLENVKDQKLIENLSVHYNEVSKINSLEPSNHLNLALNKMTSFFLTNDERFLKGISSIIKKGSYRYELKFKKTEKKLKSKKPKISKKKAVKEQTGKDELIPVINVGDFYEEETPYLDKRYRPADTALTLSKYLNFINPSELKLMIFYKKLSSDFKDNSYIIYDLLLVPNLWYKNEFTENLIKSIISFNFRALAALTDKPEEYEYVNPKWRPYYYFLLDKDKKEKMLRVYPESSVRMIDEVKDWKDALDKLSKTHLKIKLLTADKLWIQKNLYSIINDSLETDRLLYIKYLSLRPELPSTFLLKFYQQEGINFFNIEKAILNLINHSIFNNPISSENIFLQLIISRLINLDYIPQYEVLQMKEPFTPHLINKFKKDIFNLYKDKVISFLKNKRLDEEGKIKLYLNIPESKSIERYFRMLDAKIPHRIQPINLLTEKPYTKYHLPVKVDKRSLFKIQEDKYLILSNDLMVMLNV